MQRPMCFFKCCDNLAYGDGDHYLRNKIHAKILKLISLNIVNNFKQCRMKEKKVGIW